MKNNFFIEMLDEPEKYKECSFSILYERFPITSGIFDFSPIF